MQDRDELNARVIKSWQLSASVFIIAQSRVA